VNVLKVVFDYITDTFDPINTTGMSHLKVTDYHETLLIQSLHFNI